MQHYWPIHCSSSHSPSSPPSQKALSLLRAAVSQPYPAGSQSKPLDFDLDVAEEVPTSDQLSTIAEYASVPLSSFVSAHPSSASNSSSSSDEGDAAAENLAKSAEKAPNSFKWPVVVDWNNGRAAVGNVEGVKSILEEIRKKRDGESS
jgi:arsenate reductase-like glutaredoxin family protein